MIGMIYTGSCHCGTIKFQVEAPESVEVERCNCSICRKSGYIHLIVPLSQFRLLSGQDNITTYSFNTGVAQHTFCTTCGIKPFYTPRSNPDGIDININCLDSQPEHITIVDFDGQNWEQHAHTLAHKSQET
jgi:hypothetical protein